MSLTKNIEDMEKLADEEQNLFVQVRRSRVAKMKREIKSKEAATNNKNAKKRRTTKILTIQDFFKQFDPKVTNSSKEKYFYYISKNNIFDASDHSTGSHISTIPSHLKNVSNLNMYNTEATNVIDKIFTNIMAKSKTKPLSYILKQIKIIEPCNNKQRVQQEIFRFILDMHVNKSSNFNEVNVKSFSEEDFKIKFWAHILEEYFSLSSVSLHWGDTVPQIFKKSNATPKIDLRIVSSPDTSIADFSVGEFAKRAIKSKLYHDKLKAALVTKKHLNSMVKQLNIHPTNLSVPFLQIMGFDFHVLSLQLVQPKVYTIKNIITCPFPVTKGDIEKGGIESLINCFGAINELLVDLKRKMEEEKRKKSVDRMKNILGNPKDDDVYDYWRTNVSWPTDSEGEDEDQEDNDQNENDDQEDDDDQQEEDDNQDDNGQEEDNDQEDDDDDEE